MHPRHPGPASGESVPDPAALADGRRPLVLAIGIAATVGFVVLRLVVALAGQAPLVVDVWWHENMAAMLTDQGAMLARALGLIGGTVGMIVVGLIIILLFLWGRRPWDAATIAAAMIVVVAIGSPLAAIIARVRPTDSLAERVATSFPSGHTAVATAVIVTLGLLLRHGYVWAVGVIWVVLMMWSRTYLQAHWVSDVVAGMLEGVAVATLVWCSVMAVRDRRAERSVIAEDPVGHTDTTAFRG